MFNLYHADETASYRQSQLLDEVAADRLARSLRQDDQSSAVDRPSPAQTASRFVTDALASIGRTFHLGRRHPQSI